jgi:hypothetical protein
MALVSGRPISFRMDLYMPLYVPRPLVVPELFASLSPVAYGGNLEPAKPAAPEAPAAREAKGRPEDLKDTRSAANRQYIVEAGRHFFRHCMTPGNVCGNRQQPPV